MKNEHAEKRKISLALSENKTSIFNLCRERLVCKVQKNKMDHKFCGMQIASRIHSELNWPCLCD